jgi:hypothetical protein
VAVEPHPTATSSRRALPVDRRPDVGGAPYLVAGPAEGFTLESRWQAVTTAVATGVPQVQDAVFVDVYRRGADIVLVSHREQALAGERREGHERVSAPPWGDAEVFVTERGVELQLERDPWVVSVQGTVPVAELTRFVSALAPTGP